MLFRSLERSEDEGAYEAAVFDSFWRKEFEAVAEAIDPSLSPERSAAVLRDLIGRNLLSYTDMRDNPERFFEAHRLLSKRLVGGFGIRFTVQYNLFAGSILGLGGEAQVATLGQLQRERTLGCFALTEKGAGVNSGLVVNTTAIWDPVARNFVLHTPDELARKAWISQGLTASQMVVIADLIVAGKSHGPHAFLMPLRDEHGQLTPGVQVGDMAAKPWPTISTTPGLSSTKSPSRRRACWIGSAPSRAQTSTSLGAARRCAWRSSASGS